MPQPLSQVQSHAEIHVSPYALQVVPDFNQAVINSVAVWAHIDGDFGSLFSNFLKSDINTGTSVFLALQALSARKSALYAAAKAALPKWQYLAIQAVWTATQKSRKQRNKFCHQVWGYSPDLPQTLLLMDPSVVVDRNVSFRQRAVDLGDGRGIIMPADLDRSKIQVYEAADFERIEKEADQARWLVTLLYYAVGARANEKGRQQLVSEPDFQRAIEPLIRDKNPELQAQLRPATGPHPPKGAWDHLA